ncbi:MAG: hypothetical protein V1674_05945 [Candidatus Omnitrophota bacterium]
MKKYSGLIFIMVFMQIGCATYKFESSAKSYGGGYCMKRNERLIPEYTVDQDQQAPKDLDLAKQRFNRRKGMVKYYYGKMGYIDSPFKMYFVDYFKLWGNMIIGVFKMPFVAISYNKYEKDPKYREKIDNLEAIAEQKEEARIRALQDALNKYIKNDSEKEEQAENKSGQKPGSLKIKNKDKQNIK